jgi:hypothetical protein
MNGALPPFFIYAFIQWWVDVAVTLFLGPTVYSFLFKVHKMNA